MTENHRRYKATLLLPLFAATIGDSGFVFLLRSGSDLWVPLFTSKECLRVFAKETQAAIRPLELATINDLQSFLECPPTPSGQTLTGLRVAIDLLDSRPSEIFGFTVEQLIDACQPFS